MIRLLLLAVFIPYFGVLGANILYLDSVPSLSHHIWNEVMVGGLLQNGHNVTLIGYYEGKIESPNYTVLKINYTVDYGDMDMDTYIQEEKSPIADLTMFWELTDVFTDIVYESDALQVLLNYPKDAFDLIIIDVGYMHFYPLIEHFGNPPVVGASPFSLPPYILNSMGAEFYSYYPVYASSYSDQMTFWQRLVNYGLYIVDYDMQYHSNLLMEEKAKKRFGPNTTKLMQVQKKFNILLANYDPIVNLPEPLPPHIIPVGGLHVKRPAELSEDLKKILDGSKDGVIFFSFGTNLKWSWLSAETRKAFLKAFSKLKLTVLWKYDLEDLENIPKNVIIRKWFPQSSILEHKNVKLFITHGGGLSSHEAIYHGVPMLGIPFFMDQKNNVRRMEAKMVGKQLKLADISEDALTKTILEIIGNPIYSERLRKYSEAYQSRKQSPLERAVFWIELALKQKDLSYLWPRARDMNFWERQNLDIFLFVTLLLTSVLFVLFKLLKWGFTKIFSGKSQQKIKIN